MTIPILSERDLDFMLYELFDCEGLIQRQRYSEHNRETFNAALNTAKVVAEKHLLPIRKKVDTEHPTFDGKNLHILPEIKTALDAIIKSGLGSATADFEQEGMQLPKAVSAAANAYLIAAGGAIFFYTGLTSANASLITAHGTEEQIRKWVLPMRSGRFAGTMAMTEPGAGSGLGDLTTTAVKDNDGSYRITGNKIFISGGEHNLSENIIHLVLARVKGAPKGAKGISLFIVPKYLVNDDGSLGERNEVALAGIFHKMGGHGQTSTALNFGEQNGAIGYLVGEENKGLGYMFHMMNEARIMVGTAAAATALTGFQYSLHYARNRPQGRLPSCKDPHSPPVNIIQHADIRRMLLAQKAYAEAAFALCLYGAQLADDELTAPTEEERQCAHILLNFLTPIIKTWPSEYGPKANSLAIQVLGGHGYINEHPVEMFYRDNRLNPIHEGTTCIQSLDLLSRKVPMNNQLGYQSTIAEMEQTLAQAKSQQALKVYVEALGGAITLLQQTTSHLINTMKNSNVDLALANSVKYLDVFGHVVIAWLWLRQGMIADKKLTGNPHITDEIFYRGKIQTMQYFFRYELPQIYSWSKLLMEVDSTCYDMKPEWF